jgi:putative sporulation protein YtaF
MHWLTILFIGIASNLDNLGVGVSLGMRTMRISQLANLIIAVISMLATYLTLSAGQFVAHQIPSFYANLIGGLLITAIGIWTIWTSARKDSPSSSGILQNPDRADIDQNALISWKESIPLGLALSLNALTNGFGAGISGISPVWTTISVGIFSFITVDLGLRAGYKISQTWIGKYANQISGILLIAIGVYEIFV